MFSSHQGRCPYRIRGLRCERSRNHTGFCEAYDKGNGIFVNWQATEEKEEKSNKRPTPVKKIGAIPSWRWWKIGARGYLTSITSDYVWFGPTATTRKLDNGELARVSRQNPIKVGISTIGKGEDWGVFSYKTPAYFREYNEYVFQKFSTEEHSHLVIGRLDNLGHVVEHEFGYRSQKAIVQELWVFHTTMEVKFHTAWIKATENRYECPLHFVPFEKIHNWVDFYSDPEEQGDAKDSATT